MHQTIVVSVEEVPLRLLELGLSTRMLRDAVEVAAAARNSMTSHHPRTFGGTAAYAEAVRSLRDSGKSTGWRPEFDQGLELTVNDNLGVAILVATGNAATGNRSWNGSRTQYPRGPKSTEALESNQLSLFSGNEKTLPARKTWMLLIYQTDERVFSELSLAKAVGEDGHIALWEERIILDQIDLNSPVPTRKTQEPTEEIDIPVKRR